MSITRNRSIGVLITLLLVAVVGCGGGDDERPTVPPNPTSTPRPTAPAATVTPAPTPTPVPTSTPVPTPTPTPTPTPVAPNAAFFAQLDLATRLDVGPNTISIVSYDRGSWPNSAYGCPLPGIVYLQVLVDGWNVTLAAGGESYEYHTDEAGDVLVNCTENRELEQNTINIASLADLRSTTLIEMRRRDGTGEFVLKSTVTEPSEITAIVDLLDVPVLREPAASCTEVFRLVFVTSSGNQTFGTICGGNSRLFRGDQSFWEGQDVQVPAEFGTLIGPYFSDEPLPVIPS